MNRELRRAMQRAERKGNQPKRRPGKRFANPLGYVTEGMMLLKDHDDYATKWAVLARTAWFRITQGVGTHQDSNNVMAALNITQALKETLGYPDEPGDIPRAEQALIALCTRGNQLGKLTPKAEEIVAVNELLALHDDFLMCITVKQMEDALQYAKKQIGAGKATVIKRPEL